jgi:hypothetical protein
VSHRGEHSSFVPTALVRGIEDLEECVEWLLALNRRTRIPEILFGVAFPRGHLWLPRRFGWSRLIAFQCVFGCVVREWFAPWDGLTDDEIAELKQRFGDQLSRNDVLAYRRARSR